MKSVKILRREDQRVLAENCLVADSAWSRLVGLLNRERLPAGEGLWLRPCNQVHGFFMRFAIDAVFLNRELEIVGLTHLRPWRMTKIHFKAQSTLELPAGSAERLGLKVGQQLEVSACSI